VTWELWRNPDADPRGVAHTRHAESEQLVADPQVMADCTERRRSSIMTGLTQAPPAENIEGQVMSTDLPMRAAPYRPRLTHLALLVLAAWLGGAPARAQAPAAISARYEWYGVYTKSKSETVKDVSSPTGQRFVTTPVAPRENSDRIPGREDVQFGVSYVLSGNKGRNVKVRHVYLFPDDGMPNSATGEKVKTYEFVRDDAMGDPVLVGWSFENAPSERIVLGDWILQVWAGPQLLLEKRFTVYPP